MTDLWGGMPDVFSYTRCIAGHTHWTSRDEETALCGSSAQYWRPATPGTHYGTKHLDRRDFTQQQQSSPSPVERVGGTG